MCEYCYNRNSKDATAFTRQVNLQFAEKFQLDPENCTNSEYEWASADCILPLKDYTVSMPYGNRTVGVSSYSFYEEDAVPETVHPSLWMNGKCNYQSGVFELIPDKIYQVRGFDIANISFIRSQTGWIVQDTGTSVEAARASVLALEQALKEDIQNHVRAVIISHSHIDHYGGIRGIVDEQNVGKPEDGKIPIYVPAGFDIEVVKENVFAGTAMLRRGAYQGGSSLPRSPKGTVSFGLGLMGERNVYNSYITPTDFIDQDGPILIDGITVDFQLTPNTEAPSEMNNYFVEYRALWLAENCCGTLHNLYPIRGAQLRDASGWAGYTLDALKKFGDSSDIVFQSHNWHHRNTSAHPTMVKDYLLNQAAIYKFIHDQTLLYANQGYTAKEIARMIEVPEELQKNWYTRPYYGSVPMNARAVFTKYLGFFNGHPTELDPLTEIEEAQTFVDYIGSEERVLEKAEADFRNGDYRRASHVTAKLVLVNPGNEKARLLCADAFEQLGYQSESSIWRNAYLQGAFELRNGITAGLTYLTGDNDKKPSLNITKMDTAREMSVKQLLQFLGIAVDSRKAEKDDIRLNLIVTTSAGQESYYVQLYHGVLLYLEDYQSAEDGCVKAELTKSSLFKLLEHDIESVRSEITATDFSVFERLQSYLTDFSQTSAFAIIEP